MILTRKHQQNLIILFEILTINKQVQNIVASVNYVLDPYGGKINPRDIQGIKFYLQATRGIEKESGKLYISVSNAKNVFNHFLSPPNKYG